MRLLAVFRRRTCATRALLVAASRRRVARVRRSTGSCLLLAHRKSASLDAQGCQHSLQPALCCHIQNKWIFFFQKAKKDFKRLPDRLSNIIENEWVTSDDDVIEKPDVQVSEYMYMYTYM